MTQVRRAGAMLLLLLAACAVQDTRTPVRAMALLHGAAGVQAPDGYCIDTRASRPDEGFAAMAGCALVSNLAQMPSRDGLITVQIGGSDTASVAGAEAELRALLSTARGVGLLSSSGIPEAIRVEDLRSGPNLVMVRFSDGAPPPIRGLEQVEWRAFLDVRGRFATVTVRGFDRAPLTTEEALRLLRQAIASLEAANLPRPVETASPET